MRVLLALDGSVPADAARRAVASLALPSGSVIDVLGVVGPGSPSTTPVVSTDDPGATDRGVDLERVVEDAVASLQESDLVVNGSIAVGRPASTIVEVAADERAELIVVGSRGRGPFASLLLGSVSAEVVDHAPCPVLVARSALDGPVLVAVDGSPTADAAVAYLVANRIAEEHPIHVLGVAHLLGVAAAWEAGALSAVALENLDEQRRAERDDLEESAARAVHRLRAAGYHAEYSIVDGHAPQQIIECATELGCGLIVMGSRGMTGLKRILVGSVARATLMHATASVLIVREPIRVELPERAEARESKRIIAAASA